MVVVTEQFGRVVSVAVGPLNGADAHRWTNPTHIEFDIKHEKRAPKGSIKIRNLSEESREFLKGGDLQVVLRAGYQSDAVAILSGEVKYSWDERSGDGVVTIIEAVDKGNSLSNSRLSFSLDPPLDFHKVIREIAHQAGFRSTLIAEDVPNRSIPGHHTVRGNAFDALDTMLSDLGAEQTVRDGELLISLVGSSIPELGPLISPETGLIGSPKVKRKKGRPVGLDVEVLLNGRYQRKQRVLLESADHSGVYIIKTLSHTGSSSGGHMKTRLELVEE